MLKIRYPMQRLPFVCLAMFPALALQALKKVIRLAVIPGYETLKCDFHMHTLSTDGDRLIP